MVEYLGLWERIHNPDFNYLEFGVIDCNGNCHRGKYYNLEDPSTYDAIKSEPMKFVRANSKVAVDEVQKIPELAMTIMKTASSMSAFSATNAETSWRNAVAATTMMILMNLMIPIVPIPR